MNDGFESDTVPFMKPEQMKQFFAEETARARAAGATAARPERGRAICEEALKVINGERQDQYGHPEDTFGKIAGMWSAYLGIEVTPPDVAHMMLLLKVAREKGGKGKKDNYVDAVGYAALAATMRGYD